MAPSANRLDLVLTLTFLIVGGALVIPEIVVGLSGEFNDSQGEIVINFLIVTLTAIVIIIVAYSVFDDE